MTDHAKCPKCGAEMKSATSAGGQKHWVECSEDDEHWTGPMEISETDAWICWDKVVGAYWREREYEKFVAKHRIGPAPQELQDHDQA